MECCAQVLKAPGDLLPDIKSVDRQTLHRCFGGRLADPLCTVADKKPGNEGAEDESRNDPIQPVEIRRSC